MGNTLILYYSCNGSTEYVAQKLGKALSISKSNILNVLDFKEIDIKPFQCILLGCSTWGVDELPYDFDIKFQKILSQDLQDKSVAIFGTGNQREYPHSFVDAIGCIYQALQGSGCIILGKVPVTGYSFRKSVAQDGDYFVGLPIDEETQSELTSERIKNWVTQLKLELAATVASIG